MTIVIYEGDCGGCWWARFVRRTKTRIVVRDSRGPTLTGKAGDYVRPDQVLAYVEERHRQRIVRPMYTYHNAIRRERAAYRRTVKQARERLIEELQHMGIENAETLASMRR